LPLLGGFEQAVSLTGKKSQNQSEKLECAKHLTKQVSLMVW